MKYTINVFLKVGVFHLIMRFQLKCEWIFLFISCRKSAFCITKHPKQMQRNRVCLLKYSYTPRHLQLSAPVPGRHDLNG